MKQIKPKKIRVVKAWAVIEKATGEIFRDSCDGGKTWSLDIRRTKKECLGLMDDYRAVRITIGYDEAD